MAYYQGQNDVNMDLGDLAGQGRRVAWRDRRRSVSRYGLAMAVATSGAGDPRTLSLTRQERTAVAGPVRPVAAPAPR